MAKPILIFKSNLKPLNSEQRNDLFKKAKKQLGRDYHVLFVHKDIENPEFECFNDNKGLQDVDIKKLINNFHYENQAKESQEA